MVDGFLRNGFSLGDKVCMAVEFFSVNHIGSTSRSFVPFDGDLQLGDLQMFLSEF
jgi:hypothetical protein